MLHEYKRRSSNEHFLVPLHIKIETYFVLWKFANLGKVWQKGVDTPMMPRAVER